MYHQGVTFPTAQPHHGATRESLVVVHDRNPHTHTGMALGGQKDLGPVVMSTKRSVTPPVGDLVELMKK